MNNICDLNKYEKCDQFINNFFRCDTKNYYNCVEFLKQNQSKFFANRPQISIISVSEKLIVGGVVLYWIYGISKYLHRVNAQILGIKKDQQVVDYHYSKWLNGFVLDLGMLGITVIDNRVSSISDPKVCLAKAVIPFIIARIAGYIIAQRDANREIHVEEQKLTVKNIIALESVFVLETLGLAGVLLGILSQSNTK